MSARLVAAIALGGLVAFAPAATPAAPAQSAPPKATSAPPATPAKPAATPSTPAQSAPATTAEPAQRKSTSDKQPVIVDSDKMERFGKESLVIFTGNVIARQANSVQYADRMEVYLDEKGDTILRTVSTGSVRIITKDCKTGTARRAEYFKQPEEKVRLIGNARVWEQDNVVSGDTIDIFLAQDRSVVLGGKQERVKAIFHEKSQNPSPPGATPAASGASASGATPTCQN